MRVGHLIQRSNKPRLEWAKWLSKHENDIDKIVMAYLHFVTISTHSEPDYIGMYFEISRVVLRNNKEQYVFKPDQDLLAAEIASQQENHGSKHITGPVLELVRAYCLLLDRSKIPDYTAPDVRDARLKKENAEEKDLFPLIYRMDSIDILSESTDNSWKELIEAIRTNKTHL